MTVKAPLTFATTVKSLLTTQIISDPHAINQPFMVKIARRLEQLRDEVDVVDAEDTEVKEVMEDAESMVAEVGAIVVAMVELVGTEGMDTAVQNSKVEIKVMRARTPGPKIITSMVNHCTKRSS